jgi:hypothetical protein
VSLTQLVGHCIIYAEVHIKLYLSCVHINGDIALMVEFLATRLFGKKKKTILLKLTLHSTILNRVVNILCY